MNLKEEAMVVQKNRPWQREQIEAAFWITVAVLLSLIVSLCVWLF